MFWTERNWENAWGGSPSKATNVLKASGLAFGQAFAKVGMFVASSCNLGQRVRKNLTKIWLCLAIQKFKEKLRGQQPPESPNVYSFVVHQPFASTLRPTLGCVVFPVHAHQQKLHLLLLLKGWRENVAAGAGSIREGSLPNILRLCRRGGL
jgi:hypothetical protein